MHLHRSISNLIQVVRWGTSISLIQWFQGFVKYTSRCRYYDNIPVLKDYFKDYRYSDVRSSDIGNAQIFCGIINCIFLQRPDESLFVHGYCFSFRVHTCIVKSLYGHSYFWLEKSFFTYFKDRFNTDILEIKTLC